MNRLGHCALRSRGFDDHVRRDALTPDFWWNHGGRLGGWFRWVRGEVITLVVRKVERAWKLNDELVEVIKIGLWNWRDGCLLFVMTSMNGDWSSGRTVQQLI